MRRALSPHPPAEFKVFADYREPATFHAALLFCSKSSNAFASPSRLPQRFQTGAWAFGSVTFCNVFARVPSWCHPIPGKSPVSPRSFTSALPSFWWTMPYPFEPARHAPHNSSAGLRNLRVRPNLPTIRDRGVDPTPSKVTRTRPPRIILRPSSSATLSFRARQPPRRSPPPVETSPGLAPALHGNSGAKHPAMRSASGSDGADKPLMDRDRITRTRARAPGAEYYPTPMAAHQGVLGCTGPRRADFPQRGEQEPTDRAYIELGNLAGNPSCWHFGNALVCIVKTCCASYPSCENVCKGAGLAISRLCVQVAALGRLI